MTAGDEPDNLAGLMRFRPLVADSGIHHLSRFDSYQKVQEVAKQQK
jgi:hypothetical protein